jgi:hypothetical protein
MKAVAENATAFYVCDSQERWRFVKTMLQNIKTNCAFFCQNDGYLLLSQRFS